MSELQELLGRVAFPETPEDRDEAGIAIEALLDPEAWHKGYEAGWGAGYRHAIAATGVTS